LLLSRQLATALANAGYVVDCAVDGEQADFLATTETYDAVVLDLGLPKVDGLTVLRRWREIGMTLPVLILTARGSWHEKVLGIDQGADDYVSKPFRMEEILARLRALIRRAIAPKPVFCSVAPQTPNSRREKAAESRTIYCILDSRLSLLKL
jgi:two-component system OmpR family response regulator